MSASGDWAPSVYLKFEGERTRAARDLLVGASVETARLIVDVGCGPGNSTELLAVILPFPRLFIAARRK